MPTVLSFTTMSSMLVTHWRHSTHQSISSSMSRVIVVFVRCSVSSFAVGPWLLHIDVTSKSQSSPGSHLYQQCCHGNVLSYQQSDPSIVTSTSSVVMVTCCPINRSQKEMSTEGLCLEEMQPTTFHIHCNGGSSTDKASVALLQRDDVTDTRRTLNVAPSDFGGVYLGDNLSDPGMSHDTL